MGYKGLCKNVTCFVIIHLFIIPLDLEAGVKDQKHLETTMMLC